eukprot:scaffold518891_cov31-Prasinocladus_malaysianus.AAC.1
MTYAMIAEVDSLKGGVTCTQTDWSAASAQRRNYFGRSETPMASFFARIRFEMANWVTDTELK